MRTIHRLIALTTAALVVVAVLRKLANQQHSSRNMRSPWDADGVDETSDESFPASDPPSWTGLHS